MGLGVVSQGAPRLRANGPGTREKLGQPWEPVAGN